MTAMKAKVKAKEEERAKYTRCLGLAKELKARGFRKSGEEGPGVSVNQCRLSVKTLGELMQLKERALQSLDRKEGRGLAKMGELFVDCSRSVRRLRREQRALSELTHELSREGKSRNAGIDDTVAVLEGIEAERERLTVARSDEHYEWEVRHHFHLMSFAHFRGQKQAHLMEVAEVLPRRLMIAAVANTQERRNEHMLQTLRRDVAERDLLYAKQRQIAKAQEQKELLLKDYRRMTAVIRKHAPQRMHAPMLAAANRRADDDARADAKLAADRRRQALEGFEEGGVEAATSRGRERQRPGGDRLLHAEHGTLRRHVHAAIGATHGKLKGFAMTKSLAPRRASAHSMSPERGSRVAVSLTPTRSGVIAPLTLGRGAKMLPSTADIVDGLAPLSSASESLYASRSLLLQRLGFHAKERRQFSVSDFVVRVNAELGVCTAQTKEELAKLRCATLAALSAATLAAAKATRSDAAAIGEAADGGGGVEAAAGGSAREKAAKRSGSALPKAREKEMLLNPAALEMMDCIEAKKESSAELDSESSSDESLKTVETTATALVPQPSAIWTSLAQVIGELEQIRKKREKIKKKVEIMHKTKIFFESAVKTSSSD